MTAVLAIDDAHTRSRFLGPVQDAPNIRRRLTWLIEGPVCERLSKELSTRLNSGAILRMAELRVRLRLTREQLESGAAADLWADAILAALEQAVEYGAARFYASPLDYQAAYIRHRFRLDGARAAFFAEFSALDHLDAVQAMAELLAHTPALWTRLASLDSAAAMALVRRVYAQAGPGSLQYLLRITENQAVGPGAGVLSDAQGCAALAARLAETHWPAPELWASLTEEARIVLATLILAREADVAPARVGAAVVFLQGIGDAARLGEGEFLIALRGHRAPEPFGKALGRLIDQTERSADFVQALMALAREVAAAAKPAGRAPAPPQGVDDRPGAMQDPPRNDRTGRPGAVSEAGRDARHYVAPFAGVALVLRHLSEEGIGAAMPARERLAALAELVRSDVFPEPEGAEFLEALCGFDDRDDIPDRPGAGDLFYIPRGDHADLLALPAGAPRLSRWLALRFAAGLPGLEASSLGFLQGQFLHTPGDMWIDDEEIRIRIDRMPLYPVMYLSGRLEEDRDPPRAAWLMGQKIIVTVDGELPI